LGFLLKSYLKASEISAFLSFLNPIVGLLKAFCCLGYVTGALILLVYEYVFFVPVLLLEIGDSALTPPLYLEGATPAFRPVILRFFPLYMEELGRIIFKLIITNIK